MESQILDQHNLPAPPTNSSAIDPMVVLPVTDQTMLIIDPFEFHSQPNITPQNTTLLGFEESPNSGSNKDMNYNKLYITRTVMIPALVLVVLSSLFLIYIIISKLREVMKLYLSVVLYAVSILYFASQVATMLLYNKKDERECKTIHSLVMESLQLCGLILPAMSILTMTITRVLFLTSPFHWRETLCYKNQILGFLGTIAITLIISFSPLYGLCDMRLYQGQRFCVFVKSWSSKDVACVALTVGAGLLLPKLAVLVLYGVIYGIVTRARASQKVLTKSADSTSTTVSTKKRKLKTERQTFPWSIVIILLLDTISALPWVLFVGAPEVLLVTPKPFKHPPHVHKVPVDIALASEAPFEAPYTGPTLLPSKVSGLLQPTTDQMDHQRTPEVQDANQDENKKFQPQGQATKLFILDLLYTALLLGTACSPAAYLLTTTTVRNKAAQCFRSVRNKAVQCFK
ncbi:uncharacterized protein LOC134819983 [Bolinopsis microptera]|uniref:uncharacterized protein LOC134819983 n=1 Tax=Bolinopsis microptera TaxID=2820187 RepID=UPI00307B07FF